MRVKVLKESVRRSINERHERRIASGRAHDARRSARGGAMHDDGDVAFCSGACFGSADEVRVRHRFTNAR